MKPLYRSLTREHRQEQCFKWATDAFGIAHAQSPQQRAIRLLEETIEAYQAVGCDIAMAHRLVDFVFSRPTGDITQELGGVGLCTLAFAASLGLSAEEMEVRELQRVMDKPLEFFHARNEAKNAAGFIAAAYPIKDKP